LVSQTKEKTNFALFLSHPSFYHPSASTGLQKPHPISFWQAPIFAIFLHLHAPIFANNGVGMEFETG